MPSWVESTPRGLARQLVVSSALLAAALVAWIVTYERMRGMDAGPGTDLGALGWYVGVWVTMMAAMMLPSAAPMILAFSSITRRLAASARAAAVPTWIFVGGYLVAWTVYGLVAYAVFRVAAGTVSGFLAWDNGGRYVAAGGLALAGLYELTPFKNVCLRHCRGPLHFVVRSWRDGPAGALRMGFEHGLYCVGCCWGLMLALFALGVMSLTWMASIAALVFAQKVLPRGDRLAPVFAVLFVAAGVWIAIAPGSVPGLHVPGGSGPTMHMGG